jgi:hypothetical protein
MGMSFYWDAAIPVDVKCITWHIVQPLNTDINNLLNILQGKIVIYLKFGFLLN